MIFLLASLKTVTNSKACSESLKCLFQVSLSLVDFVHTFTASFKNNLIIRPLEQLARVTGDYWKAATSFRKD